MSDEENNETNKNIKANKKNVKTIILVSLSALLLVIAISSIFILKSKQNKKSKDNDLNRNPTAGLIDDSTKEPDENTESIDTSDNADINVNSEIKGNNDNNYKDTENFTIIEGSGWRFSEGLIAVGRSDSYEDEIYKFVDIDGNTVIPERFLYSSNFSEGLAFVKESPLAGGYIDSKGNYIIPPIYSNGNDFIDGKAIVELNRQYQIINKEGKYLLDKPYTYIYIIKNKYYICRESDTTESNTTESDATDNDTFDIYDMNLTPINSFTGTLDAISENNKTIYVFVTYDGNVKIYNLYTGELYSSFNGYIYNHMFEQTGYVVYYNRDSGNTEIHDLSFPKNKDTLVFLIDMNIEIISKDVFYVYDVENVTESYIIKNGEKQKVDYHVNSSSDDMFKYRDVYLRSDNNMHALIDSNGDIVMPYGSYNIYFTQNRIIKHEEGVIYIYDDNLEIIKQIDDLSYFYISDNYIYVYRSSGMHIYDEDGNLYYIEPKILTSDDYIRYYNNVMTIRKERFWFVTLDKRIHNADIPEYNLTPLMITDAGVLEANETIYLKTGNFKKYVNGKYSVIDTTGTIFSSNDEIFLPLDMLYEFFPNIMITTLAPKGISIMNGSNTIVINDAGEIAEVTFFDHEKNEYITKELMLENPCKTINGKMCITLSEICSLLGFYTYSDINICGISNKPIKMTVTEASTINKGFDNYAYNPKDLRRLDASLATQPFLNVLTSRFLGLDIMNYDMYYSNTIPAYEALINKKEEQEVTKDLIFVTEPSTEILKLSKDKGVELEVIPFAKEGFVFLVNADNPVDSLTVSQVRDIYAGKITNWKEVGGLDMEIIPYQRNVSSGSQTIMENVFMNGYPLMEPLTEQRIMAMGELIDVVSEYNEDINGALGYSVYYYATQMYASDMVKVLKINGVSPSDVTIRNNDYPIIVNYYLVKRKNDDSEFVKQIIEYVLSDAGQDIVDESGLVSLR